LKRTRSAATDCHSAQKRADGCPGGIRRPRNLKKTTHLRDRRSRVDGRRIFLSQTELNEKMLTEQKLLESQG